MAEEENLEGFDDLDSLLDDSEGGDAESGFAGELDDFLSDDGGDMGGGEMGGDDDAGGGDSELDSFFEDLSTIDDLEVIQDEEPPPVADDSAGEMAAVAAVAAAAPAAKKEKKPKKEKKKKEKKPKKPKAPRQKGSGSRLKKVAIILLLLGLGAGGYFAFLLFFPDTEVPWKRETQVLTSELAQKLRAMSDDIKKGIGDVEFGNGNNDTKRPKKRKFIPPPPPLDEEEEQPRVVEKTRSRPRKTFSPPPSDVSGPGYGVQVATCYFSSCVETFTNSLRSSGHNIYIMEKTTRSNTWEVYSTTIYRSRDAAQNIADRINDEYRLDGHAYIFRSGRGYKVSMGSFPEENRVFEIADALNQMFFQDITFTSRNKRSSQVLRKVIAGKYENWSVAARERRKLRRMNPRFRGAFVIRHN